ncbi:MAG: sodium:alanine symporter family protein, partial [Planococcus sp. (in: Bacteria)]|nr:sodium:alanine symporter family protein [Planococcus sp. (in: firmicutes)]
MSDAVNWLNGYVWSSALVYLILGVGLFYTIATRFFQVRHLKDMIKLTFSSSDSAAGVSSFQAVTMSIGSRVGIGNIAGVATAITFGGPGAIFWMWVMAFMSAGTAFIETTLAQVYKSKQDGQYRGGTPYYIGKGLKLEWYGVIFAIVTMVSLTILVPAIQVNTIALSMESAFGLKPIITGIVLVVLLGAVIFGGVKRIAKTAQVVVPFMAIGYVLVCGIVMVANYTLIPDIFLLIFSSAFSLDASFGGLIGAAISWGVQRGAF